MTTRTHRPQAARRPDVDGVETLTPREREVLALVAEGLSNSAVARRLWLSERTVEAHITRVFTKLRISPHSAQHRRVLAVLAYLNRFGASDRTIDAA